MLERMSAYLTGRYQDLMAAEHEEVGAPATSSQAWAEGDSLKSKLLDAGGPPQSVWKPEACSTVQAKAETVRAERTDGGTRLVDQARKYVGRSRSEVGLDCSGFVKFAARASGNAITAKLTAPGPNGCTQMFRSLPKIDAGEAKTGDLVYFNTLTEKEMMLPENRGKEATHVGILIVKDDGTRQILHMTNAGVRLNSFAEKALNGAGAPTWGATVVGYNRP